MMCRVIRVTTLRNMTIEPHLPPPTGPHQVGATLVAGPATLWYPALPSDGRPARYMTPGESERLLTAGRITGLPLDILYTTRTNAVVDAPPIGIGLPLVVLSPGFTKSRATLTALAEELASWGYAVVAVDHAHGTGDVPHDQAFWEQVAADRATDVMRVLDELIERWPGLIDQARIGMAGHSAGGASAIATMLSDPRVRAGINIDGSTFAPIPESGLARPVLLLGRAAQYTPGSTWAATTWARDWNHLVGWKRWLLVAGARHASFTDVGLLGEQFGLGSADLPATRVAEITRAYTRAFFDLHLLGASQPLLGGPSTGYPEVTFY